MNQMRAVVWKNGKIEDLGTFGGNESGATSVNNRGQVTGFALNDVPDPYSIFGYFFLGSPNSTQTRAFIWKDGAMRDIGTLGGNDAQVFPGYINDRGEVVRDFLHKHHTECGDWPPHYRSFSLGWS